MADAASSAGSAAPGVPGIASDAGTLAGLMRPIGVRLPPSPLPVDAAAAAGGGSGGVRPDRPRGRGGGRPPIARDRSGCGGREADRARWSALGVVEKGRRRATRAALLLLGLRRAERGADDGAAQLAASGRRRAAVGGEGAWARIGRQDLANMLGRVCLCACCRREGAGSKVVVVRRDGRPRQAPPSREPAADDQYPPNHHPSLHPMSGDICPHIFSTDVQPPRLYVELWRFPRVVGARTSSRKTNVRRRAPSLRSFARSHAVHREECTLCFDGQVRLPLLETWKTSASDR